MQSAMASTLVLNVIILDFIELLNQVAKKPKMTVEGDFVAVHAILMLMMGIQQGLSLLAIYVSYSSENLKTTHSGLLLRE